jgi:nucleoid DNA-binding protein
MNKVTSLEQATTVDEPEEDTETTIPSSVADPASTPDLNSLRDIIFGPTIREYSMRFHTIDRELERFHQLFEERYAGLETKLNQRFEDLNSEIHKSLRETDQQINERIDQVANKGELDLRKLSTLLDTLAQELHEKIEKVSNTQLDQIGEIRDQMRRNYDTLRNELVTETDDLDDRKVSRFTLADDLIEIAMKLKGESLVNEVNTQAD